MYNASATIIDALESVRKQDYRGKLEIIVINDGSTDNSLDIASRYKTNHPEMNIRIIDKPNSGVANARNTGIQAAAGDFIALLDSDDEWLPHKLSTIMPCFDNAEVEYAGSARNNKTLKIGFKTIKKLTRIYPKDLVFRWGPCTPSVVLRKTVIDKVGYFNEKLRYSEDAEYWLRIAKNCGFYAIPDSLVITGHGKPEYGASGLSANLIKMHEGELFVIKNAYTSGAISAGICFLAVLFAKIKYIKRKIVVYIRNRNNANCHIKEK
jgi:glycosyltransferase involved in cell wall biosynthesis